MEELRALDEMEQAAQPARRNELIDESQEPMSAFLDEETETEPMEQEKPEKDRKTGKLLRSRFFISIQVGACLVVLIAALGIRLFGGSAYEAVKRWYLGSVNESIMVHVTKEDLLEVFGETASTASGTDAVQAGARPQTNTLAVTYGRNREGPVTLSVLLQSPVQGGTVSSAFGEREDGFHQGLDITAPLDTPITASLTGTVQEVGENESYGKYVLLDHGSSIETRYAHCSSVFVAQGDRVNMGDEIAKVGNTGDSSGPHVHLELWINGTAYDPETVLRQ